MCICPKVLEEPITEQNDKLENLCAKEIYELCFVIGLQSNAIDEYVSNLINIRIIITYTIIRNSVCTPAKLPCRRVLEG
jgi:hypothetical protein